MQSTIHVYEVRPRKDHRGVDLISLSKCRAVRHNSSHSHMADFWDPVHFDHDVAQLCLNGHVINPRSIEYPEFNQEFCEKCGETTTTDCPSCGSKIRGKTMGSLIAERFYAPNYCLKCGKPYPWTEHRLRTAKELA